MASRKRTIVYDSNVTMKMFNDVVKKLNKQKYVENDMVIASGYAIIAAEMEKLRRTGRTTRIIDQCIQDIFNKPGEWISVRDHEYGADDHVWRVFNKRMATEHQGMYTSTIFQVDVVSKRVRLMIDPKVLAEINSKMGV